MKLYECAGAPSPRRVHVFLAEKGIAVPRVQVDLRAGEQLTPEFRAINPECTVPVLELDDGARIADPIGICVYFETVQPERQSLTAMSLRGELAPITGAALFGASVLSGSSVGSRYAR